MASGPLSILCLTSLLCVFTLTDQLPMRVRDIDDQRPVPQIGDQTSTTAPPQAKPDPLENIGIEPSQGYLIEGDIRIWHGFPLQESKHTLQETSQLQNGHSVTNSHQLRNSVSSQETWLEKVIPYEIDETYNTTEKQTILDAINEVMTGVNKCVEFVPREQQEDFIYITGQQSGCWSDIGKQGGNQTVSVSRASQCVSKGIIMHELLHVLGFLHEHNRPDRDKYIEILLHNVRMDHYNDFKKNPNGKTLTAYDYYSIMHYKINQFSKSAVLFNTIRIIRPGIDESKVGQRENLSESDKERISILYQCRKLFRSSITSSQSKLLSGDQEIGFKPTTMNKETFLSTTVGRRNNSPGTFNSSQESNNTGSVSDKLMMSKTPTIDLNIAALSEISLNNGPTTPSQTDTVLKGGTGETEEIGRK